MEKKYTSGEGGSIFGRRGRRFQRTTIPGFECQLADERVVFKATVDELSAQGFSLSEVPEHFCDGTKIYRAIMSRADSYYKVMVIPKWSKPLPGGTGYKVGYKILDNDWKWVHFSMDFLPAYFDK